MKIYTLLLLVFFTTLSKAQTHRFIYQFDYRPDSTSITQRHTNMVLDVNTDEIKFYEFGHINKDNFNFKLVKSSKLPTTYETFDFLENFGSKKSLIVPIAKFKKMQLDFFNDPLSEMKEKFDKMEPGTFRVAGIEVKSKDQFKDLTKKVQEHILKNHNPLYLTNAIIYPNIN